MHLDIQVSPSAALRYLSPSLRPSRETLSQKKENLGLLLDTGFAIFVPMQMKGPECEFVALQL